MDILMQFASLSLWVEYCHCVFTSLISSGSFYLTVNSNLSEMERAIQTSSLVWR